MDFEALSIFQLDEGAHKTAKHGVCAMEAVAWLEGLEHTDHPPCTCPVIAEFVRTLNDSMSARERQRLIPYLPRLVATVSPEHERERSDWLVWHAITVITPNALEQIGLADHATKLRSLAKHDWAASAASADRAARAASAAWAAWAAWAAASAVSADRAAWAYWATRASRADRAAWAAAWAAEAAEAAAAAETASAASADRAAWAAASAVSADSAASADRAAWAAEAASAASADRAAWAAEAASAASAASAADPWAQALAMLDGVLAIGPSGGLTQDVGPRIEAYRDLMVAQ